MYASGIRTCRPESKRATSEDDSERPTACFQAKPDFNTLKNASFYRSWPYLKTDERIGLWLRCGVRLREGGVGVLLEVHKDLSETAADVGREEGELVGP